MKEIGDVDLSFEDFKALVEKESGATAKAESTAPESHSDSAAITVETSNV